MNEMTPQKQRQGLRIFGVLISMVSLLGIAIGCFQRDYQIVLVSAIPGVFVWVLYGIANKARRHNIPSPSPSQKIDASSRGEKSANINDQFSAGMPRTGKFSVISRALGFYILLLGGAMTLFVVANILRQRQTAEWPSVDGKVLDVAYKQFSSRSSEGLGELAINYEYHVGDQVFKSEQLFWGKKKLKRELSVITNYSAIASPGRAVKVYYDPAKPSRAVIFTGIYWFGHLSSICFAGAFVLAGLLLRRKRVSSNGGLENPPSRGA